MGVSQTLGGSRVGVITGPSAVPMTDHAGIIYPYTQTKTFNHKVAGKAGVAMGIWETYQPNILGI